MIKYSPKKIGELIHSKEFYEMLKLNGYFNSQKIVTLSGERDGKLRQYGLDFCEVQACIVLAGLSELLISDTGRGKSKLAKAISCGYFAGHEEGGKANWADGRPNFEITDLFERQTVDLTTGKYDSDTARQINTDRLRRLLNVANELNRAPRLKQNEWFDIAEGTYSLRGHNLDLGVDDYCMFLATANINKMNGDFQGTCDLDRALLNRAHVTFDLDHEPFMPTIDDEILLYRSKANPKLGTCEKRDLSDLILAANKEIREGALDNPYILIFQFLIDRALRYCEKDPYKHKGPDWPTACAECEHSAKICSKIKSCSPRTTITIPALATAFNYMLTLREGHDVTIEPMDAALQAFRFTTYHGNLNELTAQEKYSMRKQIMMDDLIEELRPMTDALKEAILEGQESCEVIVYKRPSDNQEVRAPSDPKLIKILDEKKIPYAKKDGKHLLKDSAKKLKEMLQEKGLGTDWVEKLLKAVAK